MNKFILDFELLEKNDLSDYEYITLLNVFNEDYEFNINYEKLYESLESKGFIKIIKQPIVLLVIREKAKELIESCIYKEPITSHIVKETWDYLDSIGYKQEQSFEEFVKQYRNLWKGLKVGSQGNPKSVEDKLKRWMKENPDYTQNDILRAARTYINSLEDFKYLQKADYFIYKKDKFGEQSRLSDFIDEDEIIESGWGSELK